MRIFVRGGSTNRDALTSLCTLLLTTAAACLQRAYCFARFLSIFRQLLEKVR